MRKPFGERVVLSGKDPAANPIVLRGHEGPVNAVAISPDNRWVVTGSQDERARLWFLQMKELQMSKLFLQMKELINLARITVGRKFYDEWRLCFPGKKYRKTFDELPGLDEITQKKQLRERVKYFPQKSREIRLPIQKKTPLSLGLRITRHNLRSDRLSPFVFLHKLLDIS